MAILQTILFISKRNCSGAIVDHTNGSHTHERAQVSIDNSVEANFKPNARVRFVMHVY